MLGGWGWAVLEFLRDHQLAVSVIVVGTYLTYRIWKWANGGSVGSRNP